MGYSQKKRIFIWDDQDGPFRVNRRIIYAEDGRAVLRLDFFKVSELLTGNHILIDPSPFHLSFAILREALADQYSDQMVELLSLFAGLRKVAKQIVVWIEVEAPEEIFQLSRFVSQKCRRHRCLHIFKDETEELANQLPNCGFIRFEGTAIWVGGGLCGRVRGKLRVGFEST
jgi:hypothetical protein